jgi:hypothetical protein
VTEPKFVFRIQVRDHGALGTPRWAMFYRDSLCETFQEIRKFQYETGFSQILRMTSDEYDNGLTWDRAHVVTHEEFHEAMMQLDGR